MRLSGKWFAAFLFASAVWSARSSPLAAQVRPSLDLRGGAAVPWKMDQGGVFAPGELERGTSFTVHLTFPVGGPKTGLYLGFAQHTLECGAACLGAGDLVSTAWGIGLRVEPLVASVSPWITLGLVVDRSEADLREGNILVHRASSMALGPELGVGFSVRLTERISLSPGARWVRVDASFPDGSDVPIRVIAADVGLMLAF